MRCIIAGYPFDLTAREVQQTMSGIAPEPITGESVRVGRRTYPVKQVGAAITRQDRRDFSAAEVTRAMQRLGFTCHPTASPAAPTLGMDASSGLAPTADPASVPDAFPAPSPFSSRG